MKKILVVGGVAGGASFCARMRRLDETANIIMFEKGEYISFANCGLPYHIGNEIKDRDNLIIQSPDRFNARFNIDIRIRSEVIAVDTEKKTVTVRSEGRTYDESYDFLVLSPGAEPLRPPIPGIESKKIFTLRNIPDMDKIKALVDSKNVRHAAVVGGGFIGLEMAEALRHRDIDVTQIEMLDQVFAPADPEMAQIIHQHLELNGVRLLLSDGASAFVEKPDGTIEIQLKSGKNVVVDIVILAIGVKPDTKFVRDAGIAVNERGAIIVDTHMRTSVDTIYAAGDAIEVTDFVSGNKVMVPLAGPANRQARIIADNIAGIDSTYKNTQGTAICKIFNLTAAVSGMNEKTAIKNNVKYIKSYTHSGSHAGYYPGSFPMSIKILFSPDTGKLIGAQVIGSDGVDKRIDIFATAIRHGLTVVDLSELELAYAPPYGSAKDAVNIAGFTAENILKGLTPVWYADELEKKRNGAIVLDVRTASEYEQGRIDGSLHIPVDDLRKRMGELDISKPILVYCQVGLRGHVATRILIQNGYNAVNLSGGYKTFMTYKKHDSEASYLKPLSQSVCSSPSGESENVKKKIVDACGLQCPGPIMKLKAAIDQMSVDDVVEIKATEMGFAADIPAWCTRTNNSLLSLKAENGYYIATVKKGKALDVCRIPETSRDKKTMVIFSNDFDKMMAAFIIANGAASTGSEITMFFTFWGLNLLRRDYKVPVKKSLVEKMFGIMMPRGASKLTLSKMQMGGMGTLMIKQIMQKKNVLSLQELMEAAQKNNVRFVACSMSMDIMGIKKDELIDGVEIGGVASYLEKADNAGYNIFV
jgi:NADPH-dependent 2,4-dienoyl-CoA reductase/sulfur reductase-like enzyme/peroxiredoxin family protein/rhodanese-related sulfurtransferase/TusA-related sulfurtransferase